MAASGVMEIFLTKLTNDTHSFEIVRDDGSRERLELETKSYLTHDLLHYAIEGSAGIVSGVWGTIAGGTTLAELNNREMVHERSTDIGVVEMLAGALTPLTKGERIDEERVQYLQNYVRESGTTPPPWFTYQLIVDVEERMRRLLGQWRATPFREPMNLSWPPR